MVGAEWAAYIHIDLGRAQCRMVCTPFTLDPGHGATQLTAPSPLSLEGSPGSASSSRAGEASAAEIPLSSSPGVIQILAVSRRNAFTAQELKALRFAQPYLAELDLHLQRLEHLRGTGQDILDGTDHGASASRYGITDREFEVLTLLSECMLATSIAAKMSISPRTVHKHLGSLYQKLKTHDRLTAVTRARGLGLLPPA
jgi:DNA-binding CsgD family transcriptional regulator